MRMPIAALVAFATLTLTACGGSTSTSTGSGTLPETADFAPAAAAFLVSIDTDTSGDQWQKASTLLNRFPSGDELLDSIRQDMAKDDVSWEQIKATLGPEVGIAGLTTDDESVVLFTKSPKPTELSALLAKGDDPAVSKEVDGWTVAADTMATVNSFTAARSNGTLADSNEFQDAVDSVDADGIALAYVSGRTIKDTVAKSLREEGVPSSFGNIGELESLAASATAEDDGVSFDLTATGTDLGGGDAFEPTLADSFPAKPLLFVDAGHLDVALRRVLDEVQKNMPNFAEQRAQLEKALGLTVEGDLLPLFAGEVGLAVYGEASGTIPVTVDAVLKVKDEAKAAKVMDRLGALLQLGDAGTTAKVQVAGKEATELRFTGEDFSLVYLVDDGKLSLSTSQAGLETLLGTSSRLADDGAYTGQLEAAGVPDEVTSLVYADLQEAVPFVLDFAGDQVDAQARANLEPLRSIVASSSQDGDTVVVGGFVGIG